jgi:hypothetical protein
MNFVFSKDSTVSISMKAYLKECISESGLHIVKNASSPAKKDLFEADESLPMLGNVESEMFHSTIAKLVVDQTSYLLSAIFTRESQSQLCRISKSYNNC